MAVVGVFIGFDLVARRGAGLMEANFKRQFDELPMLFAWKSMRFIYYIISMQRMHRLILGLLLIFTHWHCCAVGALWSEKATPQAQALDPK
jgi:hypothetical protein